MLRRGTRGSESNKGAAPSGTAPLIFLIQPGSGGLEVVGGVLAGPLVLDDLVVHLLTFIEAGEPRTLDSGDVHENVGPTLVGLDETVTLLAVEPFHSAGSHISPFRRLPWQLPPQ